MINNINDICQFFLKIGDTIELGKSKIEEQDFKDIKLDIDHYLNRKIMDYLQHQYPFEILSEESTTQQPFDSYDKPVWILDPLDGSLNFNRSIPLCCISLALYSNSSIDFGLIYDFNQKEIFIANQNNITMNGERCSVSENNTVGDSILCTGFPSWRSYDSSTLISFNNKIKDWKKIRLLGSAALSLSWVARGYADAYIEDDIRIWDVAAGLALVKASGGEIFLDQKNKNSNFVKAIATNGKIPISKLL